MLASLAMVLTACGTAPDFYPPPVQRKALDNFRPYRTARIVSMEDADAPSHFVKDVTDLAAGTWRWTTRRPTVKIQLRSNKNLKYIIDFGIPEITFKQTGPVTVAFFVNDHELGRAKYRSAGDYHFEKAVPENWVQPGQDTLVSAEIDKVFVSPQDGARFGMTLTRIALTQ